MHSLSWDEAYAVITTGQSATVNCPPCGFGMTVAHMILRMIIIPVAEGRIRCY